MTRYIEWLLRNSKLALGITLLVMVALISQIGKFELDASSDSLVLENDQALRYYQNISRHYNSGSDYLLISYSPQTDLLADETLQEIAEIKNKLEQLSQIANVLTILDVPLFSSPPIPLAKLASEVVTLSNGKADKKLAFKELTTSVLYGNNLVSEDGKTTAMAVTLNINKDYLAMRKARDDLRFKKQHEKLSGDETTRLNNLEISVNKQAKIHNTQQAETIEKVRQIIDEHRNNATIYLGGLPMIIADVIAYISSDLLVFSLTVIATMAFILALIFKAVRWIIIPISISLGAAITMTGLISLLGWKVTVISSNYFSMLLVMTLSIIIHLIVRYRELNQADAQPEAVLKQTIITIAKPCLFTTLTTLIAFISLIASGIRPVIDFGLMMAVGVSMALVLSFITFPLIVNFLPRFVNKPFQTESSLSGTLAKFTDKNPKTLLFILVICIGISISGSVNLTVDNRFIDYFKTDTEIYQGLSSIDHQLGGTMPLEIIIDDIAEDYWYDQTLRDDIAHIHNYLESLPEVGKVLSINTLIELSTTANEGKVLNNFFLNIARQNLSENAADQIIHPYINEDVNQIRIVARIKETNKDLQRNIFLNNIKSYVVNEVGFKADYVHLTGMVVLFNNMLQSLFESQINTMGIVFLMIFIMFIIVFRSFYLAILAIIPNMLPSFFVLGIMGLLGIPLDLMTITIAAIAIGIGVDNAIHYIYRLRREFAKDNDYLLAMYRTHQSVGLAMFYTSAVVSIGFLTLVLSNFIPSIYFGIFTAVAMIAALLANLTLLPRLILWLKPKI